MRLTALRGKTECPLRVSVSRRVGFGSHCVRHECYLERADSRKTARASSRDSACLELYKSLRASVPKVWAVGPSPTSALPCVDASLATPRTRRRTHAFDAQSGRCLALHHLGSDTRRRDRSWLRVVINRLATVQVRQVPMQSADTRVPQTRRGTAPYDAIP
jgi:hypothetical protein